MAIPLMSGFQVGSSDSIDSRFVMSKAEMTAVKDSVMPIVYFAICSDDGNFYLYKKSNTVDVSTGKFRLFSGGSGGDPSIDISKEEYTELVNSGQIQTGVTYYVYDDTEGGGDAVFPEEFTTNVTVGGVASGTKIEAGTSVAEVVKNILLQYVKPVVSININPATTLYYFGQTVSSEAISVAVTQNSGKITKVVIKRGDTELDVTENEDGVTSASFNDNTEISDTITYTVSGTGSDNISATKTITFCNPSFAGTVSSSLTTVTADDITGLSKKFANNKKGYTYSGITMDFGKILYAYPKDFGALTSISDGTYSYTDSYTRSEVTVNINGTDVVYYAYLLTDATGVENFKQIYS